MCAIDSPFFDLEDEQGLRWETRQVQALGFVGKVAIHPQQVPCIHAELAPPPQLVAYARAACSTTSRVKISASRSCGALTGCWPHTGSWSIHIGSS